MIDKVQKIKEWISKEQDELMDENGNFRTAADEASYNTLCNLDAYIDSLQKEPVSDDLEEAIGEYCSNPDNFITYIDVGFKQNPIKKDDIPLIIKAIKFGSNWQKEQILDCNTTLQRTFELGKQEMKQQMMANAIDGIARPNDDEIWCDLKSFNFEDGDKVKVIIIKEG